MKWTSIHVIHIIDVALLRFNLSTADVNATVARLSEAIANAVSARRPSMKR